MRAWLAMRASRIKDFDPKRVSTLCPLPGVKDWVRANRFVTRTQDFLTTAKHQEDRGNAPDSPTRAGLLRTV